MDALQTAAVWRVDPLEHPAAAGALLWSTADSLRTDRVAAGWVRQGWRGLRGIPGPWAAALPDPVTGGVAVAHDPLGIQPLFWARGRDGSVLVSGHLPALADHEAVDDALDPEAVLLHYVAYTGGWETMRRTDFTAIRRVPFGHGIIVDPAGRVSEHRFWDPATAGERLDSLSPAESAEALRAAFEVAVRRSAADLAGERVAGYSDAALLAAGWQQLPQAPTATILQRPNPRGASQGLPPDVRSAPIETSSAARMRENGLDYHRFGRRSTSTHTAAFPQALQLGATAFVSGDSAGTVRFDGRGVAAGQLRRGRLLAGWRTIGVMYPQHRAEVFRRTAKDSLVPGALRGRRPATLRRAVSPEAAAADLARFSPIAARLKQEQSLRYRNARSAREFQVALLMSGEAHRRLETMHALATRLGLRFHAPMLDVDLVELSLGLPDSAWVHDGWPGWVWRTAMEPWLGAQSAWPLRESVPVVQGVAAPPARESLMPPRVMTENDPLVRQMFAAVAPQRSVVPGQYLDPADW